MIETTARNNGTTVYSVFKNNKLLVQTYNYDYALEVEEAANRGDDEYASRLFVRLPIASIVENI